MSRLAWYWHRLRAMSPAEAAGHVRKKLRQTMDARRTRWPKVDLASSRAYPLIPRRDATPDVVRAALRRDADDILAGRWRFFGHFELRVEDPPKWQFDYLASRDFETITSAFDLNYRTLPSGADSKVIWEPNRWYQLVRLAMAAYVLDDARAADKCVAWLEDWVRHNPPFRGWNWTSALEVGLRLVQFTWIDGLLEEHSAQSSSATAIPRPLDGQPVATERDAEGPSDARNLRARLAALREAILPPHVWYAWRHRSFGSSANNHLIGELAGCIVAMARWPDLTRCATSCRDLQGRWEDEVMAQFAEDGGNREQALNYHLFSWEFCWQTCKALEAAGRPSGLVEQRLASASRFFVEVQSRHDHWDYGDSDNASVVPFFVSWEGSVAEWHQWFSNARLSPGLSYWLGEPPTSLPPLHRGKPLATVQHGDWSHYPASGIAVAESGYWWLRWDLSPLGYLKTAAHGHLDALHISIWLKGVALVIDPGTGAYHADKSLRDWLASRDAHNAPCPVGIDFPKRLGPFLWSTPHALPTLKLDRTLLVASLQLAGHTIRRSIRRLPDADGWEVADMCEPGPGRSTSFTVRWQFAPGSWLKRQSERRFELHRGTVSALIEVDENWDLIELVEPLALVDQASGASEKAGDGEVGVPALDGIVSPAFRKTLRAPYLKLVAQGSLSRPVVFTTMFRVAPPPSFP